MNKTNRIMFTPTYTVTNNESKKCFFTFNTFCLFTTAPTRSSELLGCTSHAEYHSAAPRSPEPYFGDLSS